MDKGNKDSHKYTYSNGVKAVEQSKWSAAKARERYGPLQYDKTPPPQPKDQSRPQRLGDSSNLQDKNYDNSVPEKSWLRGGGKGGEGYPCYVPNKGGKR
jgi:hypothetical protein